jgi:hypothetical protein
MQKCPRDVIGIIFSHLDHVSEFQLAATCHHVRRAWLYHRQLQESGREPEDLIVTKCRDCSYRDAKFRVMAHQWTRHPLPFFFSRDPGLAIPLVALSYRTITFDQISK